MNGDRLKVRGASQAQAARLGELMKEVEDPLIDTAHVSAFVGKSAADQQDVVLFSVFCVDSVVEESDCLALRDFGLHRRGHNNPSLKAWTGVEVAR
jgi:hypothetical protein